MMATKVIHEALVLALVFTMLTTHQAWGEYDCHGEKELVKSKCKKTITMVGDYIPPDDNCRRAVEASDMACICRILSLEEQNKICVVKLVWLAGECGKPVPAGEKCGTWTVPRVVHTPPPRAPQEEDINARSQIRIPKMKKIN
ncbi:hypothetical protein EJB05_38775, partial [Eragrostis curvula]